MTQYSNKDIQQQDKYMLLEKMLDSGAILTDADLEMILHDDELREIYEVSADVRGACVQPSEIDAEQEWRLFRRKLHPGYSAWRWVVRVAAIFLGVLFVSGIVTIALDRLLTDGQSVIVAESTAKKDSTQLSAPTLPTETSVSCFVEANEAIPEQVVARKGTSKKPVMVIERAEEEEEEEIDIEEYLRLQQARIDNDLAILQAQLYIDQIQAINDAAITSGDGEAAPCETRYIITQ